MDQGLKSILTAIEKKPDDKLIDRFLSLIADFKDEEKKTKWALKLARVLVESHADQAMRIAHMVYRHDRQNLEALDIVIDCLKAKGRFGKAEVLKNERDKLRTHIDDSRGSRPVAGQAERLFAEEDMSQPQSIDLSDISLDPGTELADPGGDVPEYQNRRGNTRLPHGVVAQSVPPEGERRQEAQPRIRESVPIHQDIFAPGATHKQPAADFAQATQRLDALFAPHKADGLSPEDAVDLLFEEPATPRVAPAPAPMAAQTQRNNPSLSLDFSKVNGKAAERLDDPPDVAASELGVAVEMFDYYWQQGFVQEARELLKQTAPVAGREPWWQARNALMQKSKLAMKHAVKPPSAKEKPPAIEDFWQPLHEELAKLSRRLDGQQLVRHDDVPSLFRGESLPAEAWEALLRLLRQQEGATAQEILARQWEIIAGIWRDEPRPDCALLLETLALGRASTGFWGLYLDSLLVGGGARKCLQEIREFLPERPRLVWCNVAYPRLALAWQRLGLRGNIWCEDDGVWPLLKILNERPAPTLVSTIVMGGEDASLDDLD